MRMKKKISIWIICCFVLSSCVSDPNIQYNNDPQGNIEALWRIIDEKYCFIEEKGLDWDGVFPIYLAQADSICDQRQLFRVMAQMLDTLHDGHVNLYSAFDVSACSSWYDSYPANYDAALLSKYLGDYMTAGSLIYNKIPGHEDIGIIRYSSFSGGFGSGNMYYVLTYLQDCKGLIIDVRNNGGGSLLNAYKLASTFMDTTTHVGYWCHKTGPEHDAFSDYEPLYVEVDDMPNKWLRPVVVLCNRRSYSATNMFVNCMQYAPHATIMGGITGGGGGMPLSYELPNGWMVRLSSVKMTNTDYESIEEGVEPDKYVELVSSDKDDIIEAAIQKINNITIKI